MKSYKLIYAIVLSCLLVLSGCNSNIGGDDQSNSLKSSANSTAPSGINNKIKSFTSGDGQPSDIIMDQETDAIVDPTTGATVVTSNGVSLATDPTSGLYVSDQQSPIDYFSMSTLIVDNIALVNTMSGVRSIDVTNLLGFNVNPNVSNWSALYINPGTDSQESPMIAGTSDTMLISPMVLSTIVNPSYITNNVYVVARDANHNLDILYTTDVNSSESPQVIGQTWNSLFSSTPNTTYKQQSSYMTAPLAVYNSTSSGIDYIFTAGVNSTSTSDQTADQLLCATHGGHNGIISCNQSGLPTSTGAKITSLVIDNSYLFVLYNTGALYAANISGYNSSKISFSKIDNPSDSKLFGLCAPSNANSG